MENLNIKKVIGYTPTTAFEAVDLMIKAQQQVLDAINIMNSIIENPTETEFHNRKMNNFLNQFRDEEK